MAAEAYPLQWPHELGVPRIPDARRQQAKFGKRAETSYGPTTKRLTVAEAIARVQGELDRITEQGQLYRVPPDSIVISTNLRTRGDGLPYSNARQPEDPGVAVYFELDGEAHCSPCDKWDRVADNLAAIAKHIEATRGQERWGVADVRSSFKFAALPSPETAGGTPWYEVLGVPRDTAPADVQLAYRRAAARAHPDRPEGSDDAFDRVQRAWEQARQELGL